MHMQIDRLRKKSTKTVTMWIQDGLWSCEVNLRPWQLILREMSSFFIAEIGKLNLQCPSFFRKRSHLIGHAGLGVEARSVLTTG